MLGTMKSKLDMGTVPQEESAGKEGRNTVQEEIGKELLT